jgi:ribosomal protein S18 acetylase RimI-like enzyme
VLCVDEKSGTQALDRSQPVLPMMPGMPRRRSRDYAGHQRMAGGDAQGAVSITGMEQIRLRTMTAAEFEDWRSRAVAGLAAERVRAGHWDAEHAETRAAQETDSLLPDGPGTPKMLLLMAETPSGDPLGLVWIGLDRPRPGCAWLYEIEINPEHQGEGYGRALLQAAEQESARRGVSKLGLNVFGGNTVARHLYESSGYQITAMNMRKDLQGPE